MQQIAFCTRSRGGPAIPLKPPGGQCPATFERVQVVKDRFGSAVRPGRPQAQGSTKAFWSRYPFDILEETGISPSGLSERFGVSRGRRKAGKPDRASGFWAPRLTRANRQTEHRRVLTEVSYGYQTSKSSLLYSSGAEDFLETRSAERFREHRLAPKSLFEKFSDDELLEKKWISSNISSAIVTTPSAFSWDFWRGTMRSPSAAYAMQFSIRHGQLPRAKFIPATILGILLWVPANRARVETGLRFGSSLL